MSQPNLDDFPPDVVGTLALSILTIAFVAVLVWSVLGDAAGVLALAVVAVWLMATILGRSAPGRHANRNVT